MLNRMRQGWLDEIGARIGSNTARLMNKVLAGTVAIVTLSLGTTRGGDDASGPISYEVDLAKPFTSYEPTESDRAWAASLTKNLHFSGTAVLFVRTTLPLLVNGQRLEGAVYQALERPEFFYVRPGDALLRVGTERPLSPGVGGFSMHAPRSMNFIVCLNLSADGPWGVPFLSGTPVQKGPVTWSGNDFERL